MHGNSFYVWFYAIQLKELVMNNQLSFGPQGGAPCDMHSLVYQRGRLDSRDACLVSRRADENPRQKRPSKSEIQALPAVKTQAKILLSGRAQAKTRNSPRDMGAKLQTIN